MLNIGEELESWCAPGLNSIDEVSVVTAGKNLIHFEEDIKARETGGLTFTPNHDGTVTVDGLSTMDNNDFYIVGKSFLNRADYCLPAADLIFSSNGRAKAYGYDNNGALVIDIVVNGSSAVIPAIGAARCSKLIVYLSYQNGQGESGKRVYVQLELGSTATDYEPPQVTTTPIDLDGHSLRSLPDGTCDELVIEEDGSAYIDKKVQCDQLVADSFSIQSIKYAKATAQKEYADGVKFTPRTQTNDFAIVGNIDSTGITSFGTYSQSADGNVHRLGVSGDYNSMQEQLEAVKSAVGNRTITALYKLATSETIPLPNIGLPALPSDRSNIYTTSNIPVTSITVRYWKKSGELVANLYDKLAQLQGTINSIQEVVMQS